MSLAFYRGMMLAGVTVLAPSFVGAQEYIAGAPFNCTITRPRPVVTTQMQPQQVTTFCDVTETRMTQKQIVQNVPVTTCKNVTTDEGGYQMVWVPKPVTRQVAETRIHQQVQTVSVPVQVSRRVPQVSTQMVPVQSVQYVNETVPLQMTAMASACPTCGGGGMIGSTILAPQFAATPMPYPYAPSTSATIPSMPAITVPSNRSASAPTPRPQPESEQWQTVPARSASATPTAYDSSPSREVPKPKDESVIPQRKTSRFSGVPSAAAVWQAQGANSR